MSYGGSIVGDITPQEAAIIDSLLRQDPSLANLPIELLLETIRYGTPKAMPALRSQPPAPASQSQGPAAVSASQSQRLLRIIRELNRAVALAQIPATLGAQVFVEDKDKRNDLLAIMDILQTMTAAPVLSDAASRRAGEVIGAEPGRRGEAVRAAAGELGQEALIQSIPTLRSIARMLS